MGEVKPHRSREAKKSDMVDEVTLMFVIYTVFFFTQWQSDVELKFYMGYFIIVLVGGHLLVGIISMTIGSLREAKQNIKVKKAKSKYKAYRQK